MATGMLLVLASPAARAASSPSTASPSTASSPTASSPTASSPTASPSTASPPAAARSAAAASTGVSFDRSAVSTVLGDDFTIRSEITNSGATPTAPLVAHLNVVSLTGRPYVDPEDWSSSRTRAVGPLGAGGRTGLSWTVQAVSAGDVEIYVVVLPARGPSAATPLLVSPPVHVSVAGRRTLSGGGSLPVVIAVPAVLGLVATGIRLRLRGSG
jgi:hypothetical protein